MTKANPALRALLRRTPAGREIIKSLHLAGTSPETLGKGFFKKVGKVTGAITGRIAKVAAGIVGIPPGAIDALAKADPTAHKGLLKSLINSPAGTQAAAVVTGPGGQQLPGFLSNVKPVYIAAGAAGVIAIIFLVSKKKRG